MLHKSRKAEPAESYGLVANGCGGPWNVDLDETLTGDHKWFLQIDGPPLYLNAQVDDPAVVDQILHFFDAHTAHAHNDDLNRSSDNGEFKVNCGDESTVSLLWDGESNDRCTIAINGGTDLHAQLFINRRDVDDLVTALRQVREDLVESGLIAVATNLPNQIHSD